MFGVHFGETTRAARIVEYDSVLDDVRNAVFELREHIRTVVDAQTITSTEVLVNPYAHADRLRKDCDQHQDEQRDVSHNIARTNGSLTRTPETHARWSISASHVTSKQHGESDEQQTARCEKAPLP